MGKRVGETYREYRLRNLEKILERDRRYREKKRNGNPEYLAESRERSKEYYVQNKEQCDARRKLNNQKAKSKSPLTFLALSQLVKSL